MATIVVIVEGDGEVEAVPVLIRRIGLEVSPLVPPDVSRPIRVPRQRIVKEGELERYVRLAAARAGDDGRIVVLLDANGDCPAELASDILQRARAARSDLRIEVVLAKREYEAWFVSAIESIAGFRGIHPDVSAPQDPESIGGAKEWLQDRMRGSYRPTADQAALTARFDMALARERCPSFDKMWRATASVLR